MATRRVARSPVDAAAPTGESPLSMRSALWRRFDTPFASMAITALLYSLFLLAKLERKDFDASSFVIAGGEFVSTEQIPEGLTWFSIYGGYDGVFYYRLALDPFTRTLTDFGITFDTPRYRQQRILYPLLVMALSLGRPLAVPWALILVNYVALCAMGLIGGMIARRAGRRALWGLVFPLYGGFLLSLTRDLAEIVELCLVMTALLSLVRGRHLLAGALLAAAVLAKETALLLVAGTGLVWIHRAWKQRELGGWQPIAIPVAIWGLWQIRLQHVWGVSLEREIHNNIGPPLVAFLDFLARTADLRNRFHRTWFIEIVLLLLMVAVVALALRRVRGMAGEKLSWLLYLALVFSLTCAVWCEDWAFLRAGSELYVLSCMLLLHTPARYRIVGLMPWIAGWPFLARDLVRFG